MLLFACIKFQVCRAILYLKVSVASETADRVEQLKHFAQGPTMIGAPREAPELRYQ